MLCSVLYGHASGSGGQTVGLPMSGGGLLEVISDGDALDSAGISANAREFLRKMSTLTRKDANMSN